MIKDTQAAPSISVVVSVHNGGSQFRECLKSLARLRHQFFEFIVVDDGSTDNAISHAVEFGARVITIPLRSGPANGRNTGALAATGDIVLFLDADVCVHEDTIPRIQERFRHEADLGGLFGSYDSAPGAPEFVSQYRNLLHCFVHQTGNHSASTFWAGCGAIRRQVFLESTGFDLSYSVPCIEDIELGTRLVKSGVRIALDPTIQVKHLKLWTLRNMVATDIWLRGISWTRLILESTGMPNDLNLRISSRFSVFLTGMFCVLAGILAGSVATSGAVGLSWQLASLLCALPALIVALNLPFYRFLASRRNAGFAVAAVPLHFLYFFCCGTAFALGVAIHYRAQALLKFREVSLAPENVES